MDDHNLRRHTLGCKKAERIIFVAMPEARIASEATAKDRCANISALISGSIVDEAFRHPDSAVKRVW